MFAGFTVTLMWRHRIITKYCMRRTVGRLWGSARFSMRMQDNLRVWQKMNMARPQVQLSWMYIVSNLLFVNITNAKFYSKKQPDKRHTNKTVLGWSGKTETERSGSYERTRKQIVERCYKDSVLSIAKLYYFSFILYIRETITFLLYEASWTLFVETSFQKRQKF